jgi:hypothetical protein
MLPPASRLAALLRLVDRLPAPPAGQRGGRPPVFANRLFLANVVELVISSDMAPIVTALDTGMRLISATVSSR